MTFPDWFLEMAQRWLGCLNLTDEDKDAMFPNCVNLNLYEHGDHQVAWHSDDEPLFRGKLQDDTTGVGHLACFAGHSDHLGDIGSHAEVPSGAQGAQKRPRLSEIT